MENSQTAVASRKLGKMEDAKSVLNAASLYLPNDPKVQEEAKALGFPL